MKPKKITWVKKNRNGVVQYNGCFENFRPFAIKYDRYRKLYILSSAFHNLQQERWKPEWFPYLRDVKEDKSVIKLKKYCQDVLMVDALLLMFEE